MAGCDPTRCCLVPAEADVGREGGRRGPSAAYLVGYTLAWGGGGGWDKHKVPGDLVANSGALIQ